MMIFRRILTVPLIFFFVVLFVAILFITHLNGTLGSPDFYTDQLRQADMYNFLYDELVPAALDEVETDETSEFEIDVEAIKDDAVSTARQILPPEWLQAQVESAINAMLPYFTGETDEFVYTVAFEERVETAARVLKEDTFHSDAFTSIYDDTIAYLAEQIVENLDEVPYPLVLTEERMAESLRRVATEEWAASQAEDAVDSIQPYLTGDSNHFTITITLRDRVDDAAAELLELVGGQETYDYVLDELVAPMVASNLDAIVDLPFEVSFTQEEISAVVKDVLPQDWVEARLREVVDEFAAYVKGESDSVEVVVDLAEREAVALSVLTDVADEKLRGLFNSLPTCTMAEFLMAVDGLQPGALPACRPTGISYEQFKDLAGIDVAGSIDLLIGDQIPRQWVYTDADLRQSFGEGNEDVIDDARDYVLTGWTYTDTDLREDLDADQEETLDDVRDWIDNGYTWTEEDFREQIEDEGSDIEEFDDARGYVETVRTWLWTLWILPVLLLIFIGLLGGRSWKTKLMWALVVLFVTCLVFLISLSVTYGSVGEPELQEAMLDLEEYEGLDAVMAEKANELIENMADGFVSGIRWKLASFMIGSGVVLLGLFAWGPVYRSRERGSRSPGET